MKQIKCSSISITPGLDLFHTGPSLDLGPLPALFYFSLSGSDSLTLHPYNQIVQFMTDWRIRVFSLNLPAHEDGMSPNEAIQAWADEIKKGGDPIERFLIQVKMAIDFALKQQLILSDRIAVAGLSRGGLVAGLLAAQEENIKILLGFAPLTRLKSAKEFHDIQHLPIVEKYDLSLFGSSLAKKNIRFYIGNYDQRVGTRNCFECVEQITEAAHEQNIRPAQIELIISPSIGHTGHGTPTEIFKKGADWIIDHV